MNIQNIEDTWNTHRGYYLKPNITTLLETVEGYENSYNEILKNKNIFTAHLYNTVYIKTGPLRECISLHLIRNTKSLIKSDKDKFVETFLLLDRLKKIIDPTDSKIITRAYLTCLSTKKQIYEHSDTDDPYWDTINRYQFYYTGNDEMIQIINDTIFPVRPGYLYHFDHRQIHKYHNNSSQDLVLMVFDLNK